MLKQVSCFIILGTLCACSDLRNDAIEQLVGSRSNYSYFYDDCHDEQEISLEKSEKMAYLNKTEKKLKEVESSYNDFQKFIYKTHLKEGYRRIESCRNELSEQIKENHKKYLEEKKEQEEREKRWKKQREEEFKKYGKNRCDIENLWVYVTRATNPPKGCMVSINQEIMFFSVMQQITIINEPNLYRLIFRSNKPQAQAFADWVYSEVLPSIRKTGAYVSPAQQELGLVPVSSYTRRLPSGPREIKLSEKARSEIGGIVKACIGSALKDITVTQTVDPIGYNIPESLKQPDVVPAEVEKELWRLTEQLHYGLQKQQPKEQNTSVLNLFYLLRALKTVLTRYRTVQNETLFAVDMMKGDKNYEKDEALERIYILNAMTNGALRVC